MEGTLIVFSLPLKEKGMERKDAVKVYKALYGYDSHSHYGRYHNRITGLLDRVKHIRYSNGVILLKNGEETEIVRFLRKHRADIHYWTVKLNKREERVLSAE
ncbi:MAG: hypothetical protein KIY11_03840 [Thermoplasmata archaeon]|nr:hypothetical protein [Candidatus Sysuiplasma acidicola]